MSISKKIVTPPMKLSFLRMLKNYYNCDLRVAKQEYIEYDRMSKEQKRKIRPQIIQSWRKRKRDIVSPPEREQDKGLEQEREEIRREKPKKAKWNKTRGIKVLRSFKNPKAKYLNPDYVNAEIEAGKRFIPLGGSAKHYYDTLQEKEVSYREYLRLKE